MVRSTICCRFFAQAAVVAAPLAALAPAPNDQSQFLPATPLWSVEIPAAPVAPPAFAPGRILVALQNGEVEARRLADGQPAWRVAFRVEGPIAIDGDRVALAGSGEVRVVTAADGKPVWNRTTGALSAPLLASGGWIIAATGQQLVALRAEDGKEVWRQDSSGQVERATIEGDTLYVPIQTGSLRALDLATGTEKWKVQFGGAPTEVLAFADRLYAGSADKNFYCLEPATGRVSWKAWVGAPLRGRPAADERHVYAGGIDNLVRAYDRRSGALRWKADARFRPTVGPIVIGPVVVASAEAATDLRAWVGRTGAAAGHITFPEPLAEAAAFSRAAEGASMAAITGGLNQRWTLSLYVPPLPSIEEGPLKVLPGVPVTVRPPGR